VNAPDSDGGSNALKVEVAGFGLSRGGIRVFINPPQMPWDASSTEICYRVSESIIIDFSTFSHIPYSV